MAKVLFIHSPNLHEAHRTFAESIGGDFEPAYLGEVKGFRRFLNAFKRAKEYLDYPVYVLEGGMPMFPVYLKKRKRKDIKVIGLLADETLYMERHNENKRSDKDDRKGWVVFSEG